jgi:hypothetical protein
MSYRILTLLLALQSLLNASVHSAPNDLALPSGLGQIKPYLDLAGDAILAKIEKQKSWNSLTEPIPLQPQEAAKAAEKWLQSQSPRPYLYQITGIHLLPCVGQYTGRWFYVVQFSGIPYHHQSNDRSAIVLFDGTIIEPKLR